MSQNRIEEKNKSRSAIVISASSDIGTAMCLRWKTRGWKVFGTYRTMSGSVRKLRQAQIKLIPCDLSKKGLVRRVCTNLKRLCPRWDVLVMAPGIQNPVGPFVKCDFSEWEESILINFVRQIGVVHQLLPSRRINSADGPTVVFFAGGGTNNAPVNYSAYTVSKIALIKMCELLTAEIPDTKFVIVGPGWVKTKIHQTTLAAGTRAGANYQRTLNKLTNDECMLMEQVLDCCDWLIDSPRGLVSGRNFSVVFDRWGSKELTDRLAQEPDMYKLRRYGNEWLVKR
ncbi:MAG: SDR family oxidoreductase [Candidatus Omnitrophota bacterium]